MKVCWVAVPGLRRSRGERVELLKGAGDVGVIKGGGAG